MSYGDETWSEPTPTEPPTTLDITRTTIRRPADRDEWLAARRPYFNASAAAILWDRHPFMSAVDYAVTKLSGEEQAETRPMRRGRYLEAGVADWYAHETGYQLVEPDQLFIAGRVMATADRLTVTGPDRLVEIKTTKGHHDAPERYWLDQVQAQMWCVGIDTADIAWVDSSMDLQVATVDADLSLQADLFQRAERFMAAIDMGIVPDWLSGQLTADHVIALHPDPEGEVEVDDDTAAAVDEYVHWRSVRDEAIAKMGECRDFVANALGEHEVGVHNGQPIVSFKRVADSEIIDRKRLEADHPDLVRDYLKVRHGGRKFWPAA